jgi:hypothetical protein
MKNAIFIACWMTLMASAAHAQYGPLVEDTPEAACDVLKRQMAIVEGLPGGKPFPR